MRTCDFCDLEPAAWMHTLDPDRSHFRVYGKGHIWANEIALGESCERLYRDGDDEALVEASWQAVGLSVADIDEQIRKPLAVFRAADKGVQAMADWRPPGAHELIQEGFVPIEELTGDFEIARSWPEEHRRGLTDTRPQPESLDPDDDDTYWLVRSPWSGIGIEDVIAALWSWEEAHSPRRPGLITDDDRARRVAARREFFRLGEPAVQELVRAEAEHGPEAEPPG
jgi:hypothetical protein